jgi:nucleoside-diphosphate-sugar epimerase
VSWRQGYRGRRVLVLGASGFIGQRVALRLAELGAELHAGVRHAATRRALPGRLVEADLGRPGAAAEAIAKLRPSITFNLAGYGIDPGERDAGQARRINQDLVVELIGACANHSDLVWPGQQLVHVGSAAEYGAAGGDLSEATEPAPTTLYGRTKLAGTQALSRASSAGALRGLTARLFTVYGPGEAAGRLLPTLVAAAGTDAAIPLTEGSQRRDFTYVEDVVEGLLRLGMVPVPEPGAVNLATGKLTTVRAFVECSARVLGIPADRLRFGALPTRPGEMAHDPVNIGRLRSLCRWVPPTLPEEGVRRAVEAN